MEGRVRDVGAIVGIEVAGYAGAAVGVVCTFALLASRGGVGTEAIVAVSAPVTLFLVAAGIAFGDPGRERFQRMRSVPGSPRS